MMALDGTNSNKMRFTRKISTIDFHVHKQNNKNSIYLGYNEEGYH
jgi:hypothetical protein